MSELSTEVLLNRLEKKLEDCRDRLLLAQNQRGKSYSSGKESPHRGVRGFAGLGPEAQIVM